MNRDDYQRRRHRAPTRDLGEVVTDTIGTVVDYLHLRGVLVRLESREAGAELGKKVALLGVAAGFGFLGYMGLVVAITGWVAEKLEWSWQLAAAITAGLHLTVGFLAFLLSRRHPRQPLFRDTLRELEKDRQWLSRKDRPKN